MDYDSPIEASICKRSFINVFIMLDKLAFSVLLVMAPFARIYISISPLHRTYTALLTVKKLTIIFISISISQQT